MASCTRGSEKLSFKNKLARLADRMKDPEWRRYGFVLASGKMLAWRRSSP